MNTFGKILAFSNFVIALAVAAFLGVDFATRQNWKKAVDERDAENTVLKANNETSKPTLATLNAQVKKGEEDRKTELGKYLGVESELKAKVISKDAEINESKIKLNEFELQMQVLVQEKNRLKEEVEGLLAAQKKREERIVTQEDEIQKLNTKYLAAKAEADAFKRRNSDVAEKLNEYAKQLFELQNKGSGTLPGILTDPNAPNPPTVAVKGQVDEVNATDKKLVKVSVGSDHGVKLNNTLEVYRTQPRAEYLGTMRIIESNPHWSIGKMMKASQQHSPLQAGDIVVGSIGP